MTKTEEAKPPVQYCLVRQDLPVYRQMVDVGHATAEALRQAPINKRTVLRLLHVKDEAELKAYHDRLLEKGFHVGLVEEPDPPYNGEAMALATEPLTERASVLKKIFFHLKKAEMEEPVVNITLLDYYDFISQTPPREMPPALKAALQRKR